MPSETSLGRKEFVWLIGYSSPSRETAAEAQDGEPGSSSSAGTQCPWVGRYPRGSPASLRMEGGLWVRM